MKHTLQLRCIKRSETNIYVIFILSESGDRMKEENLGIFNVPHLVLGQHDAIEPCTLLLTPNRIIVVSPEGINRWIVVTVIVAFAASFTGLLLRNGVLFLGGLVAGIMAALFIGLIDFVLRRIRIGKIKHLNSKRILEMNEKNFEIRYAKIVKVVVRTFKTYPRRSYLFPSFQENRYRIDFVTHKEKHSFILDRSELQQCLNLVRQFAPETVEIEQV